MVVSPTEPVIARRLQNRYKPTVKAYVISLDDWDRFFRWLTPEVQEGYIEHGWFDISSAGNPTRHPYPGNLTVIAMTFKGVPVVSYADAHKVLIHFGRKDVQIL